MANESMTATKIPASNNGARAFMRPAQPLGLLLSGIVFFAVASPSKASADDKTTFQDQVLPLIQANCAKCHNSDKKKADLDLTSYASTLKGSGSGAIVLSGNLDGSKIWKALTHAEEPFMPPNRPKLPDNELDAFKKWILGGLLENAGAKAIAAASSGVDLTIKPEALGKPEGPPPMPEELPIDTVVHTTRGTALTGLAASPWAPLIAVGGIKEVLLFHAETLQLLGILPFTEGEPDYLTFSRNGKLLLAAGGRPAKSGCVLIWDVVTGEHLTSIGGEFDSVLAADLRADQTMVALGGPDRLVKLYSVKSGELRHKIKKHTDWVTAVAFSPNGQWLASGDRNGGISIWDPDSAQELFTLAGHKKGVTALSWRPDSKFLASSSEDGTVKLWEMKEGKQVKSWTANSSGCLSVAYSQSGELVTCGRDNAVTLWDGNGGKPKHCEFFGNIPIRAVVSSDNKRVFATDFQGRIGVWNAADQKRVAELNGNPQPVAEQIAIAQKEVADLEARVSAQATNIAAASAEFSKANAALEEAKKQLDAARAERTAKQDEVSQLSQQITNAPVELPAKLAAASAAWAEACTKATNAQITVESRSKEAEAAKGKLDAAKALSPDEQLVATKTTLNRLQGAQVLTEVYKLREIVAAKKREHDKLAAVLEADRQAQKQAEQDLAAAKAAITKAEAQIKSSQAEVSTNEPAVTKLASELKAEQTRLEALLHKYRATTNAPTTLATSGH